MIMASTYSHMYSSGLHAQLKQKTIQFNYNMQELPAYYITISTFAGRRATPSNLRNKGAAENMYICTTIAVSRGLDGRV